VTSIAGRTGCLRRPVDHPIIGGWPRNHAGTVRPLRSGTCRSGERPWGRRPGATTGG